MHEMPTEADMSAAKIATDEVLPRDSSPKPA